MHIVSIVNAADDVGVMVSLAVMLRERYLTAAAAAAATAASVALRMLICLSSGVFSGVKSLNPGELAVYYAL